MPPRLPELDALRGLAALGVLALHTAPAAFFWAWSCVDLFFVLSGFLITRILQRGLEAPAALLRRFYWRRVLRIWPVYYLTLGFCLLCFLLVGWLRGGAWPGLPSGQWLSLFFLQYLDRYLPGMSLDYLWYFDHAWSLAVEEQFYLVWPLTLIGLRRWPGLIPPLLGLGLAAGVLARLGGLSFHLLLTRVDGLLFGILLAHLLHHHRSLWERLTPRRLLWGLVAVLLLLLPYLLRGGDGVWAGPLKSRAVEVTLFCAAYALLVALCLKGSGQPWLAPLRHPLLVHLGRISFAVYMFQVPLAYLLLEAQVQGWLDPGLLHPALWVLTLGLAHLSWERLEKPLLQRSP